MTVKKKILCVVQLPPPVHGASLMNSSLVNSALINGHYQLKVTDIGTARTIEEIGKLSLKKIVDCIGYFFRIAGHLVFFRPHLCYFTFSPSGFAFYRDSLYVLMIKFFHRPLVIHLHGKGIEGGKGGRIRHWLSAKVFNNTDIIFLSPKLTADIGSLTYKRSFIVNCGIPSIAPVSDDKKDATQPNLLFLSNYVRSKGVIDLIDAITLVSLKNRDFHLRLVGKPFDISMEELEEYIRDKGLESLISVCGPRYQEEKFDEFRKADLFIFPTYYANEAFPLVLLEAMQWGLPVISTREGGIPDMVEDGVTGLLIDPRDIDTLSDKILYLLQHPEKRVSMGVAARKIFLERFTLTIFEENMLQTFRNILQQ